MTPQLLVWAMQTLFAMAWAVPFARKLPSVIRVMAGRGRGDDNIRAIIWFLAADMEGGALRWFMFRESIPYMRPNELFAWSGVYALSIVCALALSFWFWERRTSE